MGIFFFIDAVEVSHVRQEFLRIGNIVRLETIKKADIIFLQK